MRKSGKKWWKTDAARLTLAILGVGAVGLVVFRASSAQAQEEPDRAEGEQDAAFPLRAKLSAYWPAVNASELPLEGESVDTRDRPLYSLQDYLAGKAPFVSVAGDLSEFDYNEPIEIKELNELYERTIDFRVHDALHADRTKKGQGTGTRRLDIRVNSRKEGLSDSVNSWVHFRRPKPPSGAIVAEVRAP